MTTEETNPPAVVLSTAQLERFEEAVGSYWDCAYQEGHLNRPDGDKANAILHEIRCAVAALVAAEREACAKVCETGTTTLQHNHVNDGNPWETRNDPNGYCAAAIRLRSNAEVSGLSTRPPCYRAGTELGEK